MSNTYTYTTPINGTVSIASYTGTSVNPVIPLTDNAAKPNKVIGINSNVFSNKTSIESVDISSTNLLSIGSSCFNGCTNLSTVVIQSISNIISIGNNAFQNTKLETFIFPENINFNTISQGCFNGCQNLKYITIPNNIQLISPRAFFNCTTLTTVNINQINSNLKTIKFDAFRNCQNLSTFTIPNSLLTIENASFNSSGLTEVIIDPIKSNLSTIENSAFFNCDKLITFTFPENNNFIFIDNGCFRNCDKFTSIIIPDNVRTIDFAAFSECLNLSSVTIGKLGTHCKTISSTVLSNCPKLTSITIIGPPPISVAENAFQLTPLNTIYYYQEFENLWNPPPSWVPIGVNVVRINDGYITITSKTNGGIKTLFYNLTYTLN